MVGTITRAAARAASGKSATSFGSSRRVKSTSFMDTSAQMDWEALCLRHRLPEVNHAGASSCERQVDIHDRLVFRDGGRECHALSEDWVVPRRLSAIREPFP